MKTEKEINERIEELRAKLENTDNWRRFEIFKAKIEELKWVMKNE